MNNRLSSGNKMDRFAIVKKDAETHLKSATKQKEAWLSRGK